MAQVTQEQLTTLLSSPLTLPCGLVLPNRLVKVALEEMLSELGGGFPSRAHGKLHAAWAQGGWGLIISGNVQVSASNLGLPFDVVFSPPASPSHTRSIAAFRSWAQQSRSVNSAEAASSSSQRTPSILQMCHTGRQSMRGFGRSPWKAALCPSATPLAPGGQSLLNDLLFGTPKEMEVEDLDAVVEQFKNGARIARASGWDGVQLHAAHGYLIAQFLSPNINKRTDEYGGSLLGRCKFLLRVIDAVREECSQRSGFCLGIKLNSSDYVKGGLTEEDALETVRILAEHGGVDFIEISGGTYENPAFMTMKTAPSSTSAREAFFQSFAQRARSLLLSLDPTTLLSPPPAILITGGLRSRTGIHSALSSACDLAGMGRPAIVEPRLPLKLLDPAVADSEARATTYEVRGGELLKRLAGAELWMPGIVTLWHTLVMWEVVRGKTDVRVDERVEWKLLRVCVFDGVYELLRRHGVLISALFVALVALLRWSV